MNKRRRKKKWKVMLKLVEIQIVVTTLIDHFLFFLQFSVMCWDIYWNIHVLIWASWVHPIYCDICFVLPSASDILRYILSCRTIAIYDLPFNLRNIYKRVSPLVLSQLLVGIANRIILLFGLGIFLSYINIMRSPQSGIQLKLHQNWDDIGIWM